jgi:hypothetical protein
MNFFTIALIFSFNIRLISYRRSLGKRENAFRKKLISRKSFFASINARLRSTLESPEWRSEVRQKCVMYAVSVSASLLTAIKPPALWRMNCNRMDWPPYVHSKSRGVRLRKVPGSPFHRPLALSRLSKIVVEYNKLKPRATAEESALTRGESQAKICYSINAPVSPLVLEWNDGGAGEAVGGFQVEQPYSAGEAAGGADALSVDADDHAKLADDYQLAGRRRD